MTSITGAQLRAIVGANAPRCDEIAAAFNASAARFGLDAPLRAAHFFAQIGHESGSFRYVREIWGPTEAQRKYEGRADLGNTRAGDGKRYMGRGLIQITGRSNARAFAAWAKRFYPDAPDFEASPEMMERMPWALAGAFWFWTTRGLNAVADRDDVLAVTRRINGGVNGLDDRRRLLARAKTALRGLGDIRAPAVPVPTPPPMLDPAKPPAPPLPAAIDAIKPEPRPPRAVEPARPVSPGPTVQTGGLWAGLKSLFRRSA